MGYFANFGRIERADILENNVSRFCRLRVSDSETFNKILSFQKHKLKGRDLLCTKFLHGRELYVHLKMQNKNRVIIKNVPNYVKMKDLAYSLEKEIGKIVRIFHFKSENDKKMNRQFSTFAVTLSTPQQSDYITSASKGVFQLTDLGITVTCIKFKQKIKTVIKNRNLIKYASEDIDLKELPKYGSAFVRWNNENRDLEACNQHKAGFKQVQEVHEEWSGHYHKPTSRVYHKPKAFSNHQEYCNYRFNCVVPGDRIDRRADEP